MGLKKIEIINDFGIKELSDKLRTVRLKGFPNVKIYENADIQIKQFTPTEIENSVFTPQPTIFRQGFLTRIGEMREIFAKKGIDVFNLNGGVNYFAFDDKNEKTEWTLISPVIENIPMNFNEGGLNYTNLIGPELRSAIEEKGHIINPEIKKFKFDEYHSHHSTGKLSIICDGSHRVHYGIENKINQNLLIIDGIKEGFPYYAMPKPYSVVHIEEVRPEEGGTDKTHILTEPGHKLLYRLFPTGGIMNGVVRSGADRGE